MNYKKKNSFTPPYQLVSAIGQIRSVMLSLYRRMFPGNVVLYEHFQNLWILPSLYVAAELDISEILRNEPKNIEEISRLTGTDCESLYRVLRALSCHGIYRESGNRCFSNTPTSRAMLNGENSIRHVIRHHLGYNNWNTMGNLLDTVKTGKNAFQTIHGESIYQFLQHNREQSGLFDKSMSELSELSLLPLISRYDFSKHETIADIGGGEGQFLASLLQKYPGSKGILFDLPEATVRSAEIFEKFCVTDRISVISGNFLESIRVTSSLYLLKHVLHNWNDKNCTQILQKIRESMPDSSKLLIIEMVILPTKRIPLPKLIDVQMLASFEGGKERTKNEYKRLINDAGLTVKRFIPTIAPLFLIEAVKK